MIPNSLSGESQPGQRAEHRGQPRRTRPTWSGRRSRPRPMGGSFAPIYVSTDGGNTWSLRTVVPGNGSFGTGDITVGFADDGRHALRRHAQRHDRPPADPAHVELHLDHADDRARRPRERGSAVGRRRQRGRRAAPRTTASSSATTTSTSRAARRRPSTSRRTPRQPPRRPASRRTSSSTAGTTGQDGPPVRIALHPDGTVYAAFQRWVPAAALPNLNIDVVVTRDDGWGPGHPSALPIQATGAIGSASPPSRFIQWNATMGQERLGGDLSIAVDPTQLEHRLGRLVRPRRRRGRHRLDGARAPLDRHGRRPGRNDLRTITNVKNPSLAVNSQRPRRPSLPAVHRHAAGSRRSS